MRFFCYLFFKGINICWSAISKWLHVIIFLLFVSFVIFKFQFFTKFVKENDVPTFYLNIEVNLFTKLSAFFKIILYQKINLFFLQSRFTIYKKVLENKRKRKRKFFGVCGRRKLVDTPLFERANLECNFNLETS